MKAVANSDVWSDFASYAKIVDDADAICKDSTEFTCDLSNNSLVRSLLRVRLPSSVLRD